MLPNVALFPQIWGFYCFLLSKTLYCFQTIKSLSEVYHSPHDIDLLVGGLAERPDGDSLLGPTLSCIVADQFLRTRRGDRYFYSNEDQPVPFSKAQIREIDRISLARIFCDNGDDIETMQNNVFKRLSVR